MHAQYCGLDFRSLQAKVKVNFELKNVLGSPYKGHSLIASLQSITKLVTELRSKKFLYFLGVCIMIRVMFKLIYFVEKLA